MKVNIVQPTTSTMDATPTPRILALFENLAVEPWRSVAELVDNSLDDFRNNSQSDGKVEVFCSDGNLVVSDNGSGMTYESLENAIKAGYSSKKKNDELGLFGVGFNIACARLGRKATVWTKSMEDKHWLQVEINIDELIKQGSFKIQPLYVDLDLKQKHGTIVAVSLSRTHLANFERKKYMESISKKLGRAYSYILRAQVPGLSGDVSGNPRNVVISVGELNVKPWIPCIWDEKRYVKYKGVTVYAVQQFNRELPEVSFCNDCGFWHTSILGSVCEQCGSSNLEVGSRKIWGWIGVQRYMDKLSFGINFLRNGRNIIFQNQNIFSFSDPTTGETFKDYPVEWPADQGRIVGEVHCDHVGVDFIKREFDVTDPFWAGVLEVVRGSTSLQPKRQRGLAPNTSPLATIFNAFRINEPGTRYLIPGNGTRAVHDATRNWALKFEEGEEEFQTDSKWYEAAVSHDNIAKGASAEGETKTKTSVVNPTVSPTQPQLGSKEQAKDGKETAKPKETIKQKMERWKSGGAKREDLSKVVTPTSIGKSFKIECWETFSSVSNDDNKDVSVLAIPLSGNQIAAFAHKNAEIFQRFGRSTTDLLLLEIAHQIKNISGSNQPVTLIFSELLSEFPDEERSEKVLRSRISEMQTRLQVRISQITAKCSTKIWKSLSSTEQNLAEQNAVGDESVVWSKAISAGSYGRHLTLGAMREIVEKLPELLFDGKLFKQHYASSHALEARQRSQGYLANALRDLSRISQLSVKLNNYEIRIAENFLDFLNESLAENE